MTRILTRASAPSVRNGARPFFRLAPAGLPVLAALLSCAITLASFSTVDACAATGHATTAAYVASASA